MSVRPVLAVLISWGDTSRKSWCLLGSPSAAGAGELGEALIQRSSPVQRDAQDECETGKESRLKRARVCAQAEVLFPWEENARAASNCDFQDGQHKFLMVTAGFQQEMWLFRACFAGGGLLQPLLSDLHDYPQ